MTGDSEANPASRTSQGQGFKEFMMGLKDAHAVPTHERPQGEPGRLPTRWGPAPELHRSQCHPAPENPNPCMSMRSAQMRPQGSRLDQGRGEGRLRLLGSCLSHLPPASQEGGDPPEAHVPPAQRRKLMRDGHRWLEGRYTALCRRTCVLQDSRRASAVYEMAGDGLIRTGWR